MTLPPLLGNHTCRYVNHSPVDGWSAPGPRPESTLVPVPRQSPGCHLPAKPHQACDQAGPEGQVEVPWRPGTETPCCLVCQARLISLPLTLFWLVQWWVKCGVSPDTSLTKNSKSPSRWTCLLCTGRWPKSSFTWNRGDPGRASPSAPFTAGKWTQKRELCP